MRLINKFFILFLLLQATSKFTLETCENNEFASAPDTSSICKAFTNNAFEDIQILENKNLEIDLIHEKPERQEYLRLDPLDPEYSWMDEQIEKEFIPFANGITREMLDETEKLNVQQYWRYRVENSIVFGPDGPVKQMLNKLIDLYTIPDVEFLYYEHDGFILDVNVSEQEIEKFPHKKFHPEAFPGPILTSAKHRQCSHAILFHDWYFYVDESHPTNWPILSSIIERLSEQIPWENKIPVVFWRGLPNGPGPYTCHNWKKSARGQISYLSYLYPALINAGFCNNNSDFIFSARDVEGIEIHKPWADHAEHMKYKFQLNLDGHTCTYPGLQWRLLSNCTVFLQETDNIMWYHTLLKPWVHYVPIKEDLSDIIEKTVWAKNHDDQCHLIALQGQELARKYLLSNVTCLYCYKVLVKYASLQRF